MVPGNYLGERRIERRNVHNQAGVYKVNLPCVPVRTVGTVLVEMVDKNGLYFSDEFPLMFHMHYYRLLKWLLVLPLLGMAGVLLVTQPQDSAPLPSFSRSRRQSWSQNILMLEHSIHPRPLLWFAMFAASYIPSKSPSGQALTPWGGGGSWRLCQMSRNLQKSPVFMLRYNFSKGCFDDSVLHQHALVVTPWSEMGCHLFCNEFMWDPTEFFTHMHKVPNHGFWKFKTSNSLDVCASVCVFVCVCVSLSLSG